MQRWNPPHMLEIGRKLFSKIHAKKRFKHHNSEVHFLAREVEDWLPQGVESLVQGKYSPRHLRRYYFEDDMVDQLHTMNSNCVHVYGPNGVKIANKRIREVLVEQEINYIIRADIKSFYRSIPHVKLIQDIRRIYDDPKVQHMLESIITNSIETPGGYKNPHTGIALRGPLSQLFSAIYLKPLDDAFDGMDVTYIRYQDDIIILCKTKRQLSRCRRRMMEVLHERRLRLSRKKSRMGNIDKGFHFLGINYNYLGTQTQDNTDVNSADVQTLNSGGCVFY